MPKKSKFATVVLSVLPGLGHMYLGWRQRGLLFMLAFFVAIFLTDWTSLLLFGFLIPVVWFFSLFDALQCLDQNPPPPDNHTSELNWFFEKQRWIGISLIVIGCLVLIDKLAYPILLRYFTYEMIRAAGISLVALLLIAGGIRLAWGKPLPPPVQQEQRITDPGRLPEEQRVREPARPSQPREKESLPGELPQEEEQL